MEMWDKFMKLVKGSRYCVFLRSAQNSLLIQSNCKQSWWKASGEQVLQWQLPDISPVSREAHIKHQWHMWIAVMGGKCSSYDVCFQFLPQTQLHMLLHFSSLCTVIHVACCLTLHCMPVRGLTSAEGELCTRQVPPHQGQTHSTACAAPALLQVNIEYEFLPLPARSASGKNVKFRSLPQLQSCCSIQLREDDVTGSKLCPLGHRSPANNPLVSLTQHHAWCSHIDLSVQYLHSNM